MRVDFSFSKDIIDIIKQWTQMIYSPLVDNLAGILLDIYINKALKQPFYDLARFHRFGKSH